LAATDKVQNERGVAARPSPPRVILVFPVRAARLKSGKCKSSCGASREPIDETVIDAPGVVFVWLIRRPPGHNTAILRRPACRRRHGTSLTLDQAKDGEMSQMRRTSRRTARPQFRAELLESRQLLSVNFISSVYTASAQAGTASITLENNLGLLPNTPTQVVLSLGGGSAVPGVDYTPGDQTVSFAANQATQTVEIPLLPGSPSEGSRVVDLELSPTAGTPPTEGALLFITHNSDTTPPTVTATKALTKGPYVTGFVITFSKAMAPGPLQDVNNYVIDSPRQFLPLKRHDSKPIKLKSAVYNPSTDSVTLTTAGRVKKSHVFMIMDPWTANELTVPLADTPPTAAELLPHLGPFTDTSGNPLASDGSGTPDGLLQATVAVGKIAKEFAMGMNQTGPVDLTPPPIA
jgi:hypothetical protein